MSVFALRLIALRDIAVGAGICLGRAGVSDRLRDKSADVRGAHVAGWIDVYDDVQQAGAGAHRKKTSKINARSAIARETDRKRG